MHAKPRRSLNQGFIECGAGGVQISVFFHLFSIVGSLFLFCMARTLRSSRQIWQWHHLIIKDDFSLSNFCGSHRVLLPNSKLRCSGSPCPFHYASLQRSNDPFLDDKISFVYPVVPWTHRYTCLIHHECLDLFRASLNALQ